MKDAFEQDLAAVLPCVVKYLLAVVHCTEQLIERDAIVPNLTVAQNMQLRVFIFMYD